MFPLLRIFRRISGAFILTLLVSAILTPGLDAARAEAAFDPPVITEGQNGVFRITFENVPQLPSIEPPRVDGLVFSDTPAVGQRSSLIYGVSSVEYTLSWRVAAQESGTYVVPGRTVSVGGQSVAVPSARLRVVPMSERERSMFQLNWDLPEKRFYVGESIPAFLRVAVQEGIEVRIPALPVNEADGFQISAFTDQVAQERETINGIPYRVFIWSVVITPIRAGELSLQTGLTLVYADPQTTRFGTDTFGIRRVREQQRRLTTGRLTFEIREPPAEGRLPGFNGGIGVFAVESSLGRDEVRAGEPLTLTIELTGAGNFERIPAPALPATPGWRTYPPRVNFEGETDRGLRGTKTFEYLLIPESEAITETPAVPWAVFNPYTEQYEALTIPPHPISVAPAPPSPGGTATVYGGRSIEQPGPAEASWRPNRAEAGRIARHGIRPIFLDPLFWSVHGAVAFVVLVVFLVQQRRHRLAHDEDFARRVVGSRSVRQWARQAEEAARSGDAPRFYSAAQRALQESAGRCFPRSRRPESLTLAEIEETLLRAKIPEGCRNDVAHLFQTGDALKYAGFGASPDQLQTDAERLVSALRELHKGLAE